MFKLSKIPQLLHSPDDAAQPIEDKELSKEETIKLLGDDDGTEKEDKIDLSDKPKPKKEKDEKEEEESDEESTKEDDDEDDELKELEEELEEPDEDKLELMTPARRRDILKKFPTLFKDFPYLERAYYREQQFTELLPTIEDAKVAVEKSKTLDNFERDLLRGNTETILKAVREEDSNSFNKIVDDYLPSLARVDEKAYYHVLGTVIKNTILSMVQESKKSNNESLQSAAYLLNQFVFGTSDFEPATKLTKEETDKSGENELKRKEQELTRRQFDRARSDLGSRIDNVLKATINGNIDPKESMTDYVKKNASREALETLQSMMDKDTRFKVILDKLWERAFSEDFSVESVNRIKSAYLSRAKTLLPSVIKKARNEALKGLGKRVKEEVEDDEEESSSEKPRKSTNRERSTPSLTGGKSAREAAKKIPANMSSADFLMQD